MHNTFFNGKLNRYTTERLLSTKDGRIVIETLEDVMVYAQTQGICFYDYYQEDRLVDYALDLAELNEAGESQ